MTLRWMDIIKEITDIAVSEAGEFDALTLTVTSDRDGGNTEFQCGVVMDDKNRGVLPRLGALNRIDTLTRALRDAVKDHTGGDLKAYTIHIDETGKARANFEYHDPEGEDAG